MTFRNLLRWFSVIDLRRCQSDLRYYNFRPHVLHPNYVTAHGEEYCVTLQRPGVVIRVPDGQILVSGLEQPHDGIIVDGEYILTECLNPRVLIFDLTGGVPGNARLIANVVPSDGKGFVRGVCVVDEHIFIGLSALKGDQRIAHSRILALDRRTCQIQGSWKVPEKFGNAIYSILDVTPFYR